MNKSECKMVHSFIVHSILENVLMDQDEDIFDILLNIFRKRNIT